MRAVLVCAVVLVAIANGINGQPVAEGKEQVCQPGSQTRVDCNTCTCSKDGSALACTRMECPKIPAEYLNPDGSIKLPHQIHGNPLLRAKRDQVCEPGTVRDWECNKCRCSPDGTTEFCTRSVCPDSQRQRRETRCTPNQNYMDDCNSCICGQDGRPIACTSMACSPQPVQLLETRRTRRDQVCEPGTQRMLECNRCWCSPDGTVESCTRKACVKDPRTKREVPFSCKPGENFMMDCNSCICAADGRSAACTLKFCL